MFSRTVVPTDFSSADDWTTKLLSYSPSQASAGSTVSRLAVWSSGLRISKSSPQDGKTKWIYRIVEVSQLGGHPHEGGGGEQRGGAFWGALGFFLGLVQASGSLEMPVSLPGALIGVSMNLYVSGISLPNP